MKKIFLLAVLLSASMLIMAMPPKKRPHKKMCSMIERLEPENWWAGMHNTELQLMFYGEGIGKCKVFVKDNLLKIIREERTANPNYLFVYLDTEGAKPGSYEIVIRSARRTQTVKYELKERKENSAERKSFGQEDAVYLIMPDRFADGNEKTNQIDGYIQGTVPGDLHERQGGDIEGIISHLDYIADLGITALWTTPILEDNDEKYSYHHYSTTNYYKVDPRLGTNEDFVRLVDECHNHGLKYIMDIVPNHANPRHWWHKDLPDSTWYHQWPTFTRTNYKISTATDPHASKFDRELFEKGWFDTNMADLNLKNPLLFDYVKQSYIYWAEKTGLDGFRVDTYPFNDLNCVAKLMKSIRYEYPNINLVGECWVKSIPELAYYQSGNNNRDGFDSQLPSIMDFVLKDWLEMAFVEEEDWNTGVIRFYNHFAQDFAYPNPDLIMNMLNNHDMSRYSNAIHRDIKLHKMGLAMLATVRGYPQYYYGDEIMIHGEGSSYEDARHRFPGGWKEDERSAFKSEQRTAEETEIYDYLRKILQYRKKSEALTRGKMIQFVPYNGIYCFFRYTANQTVMVVVNNNSEDTKVDISRFNEMDILNKKAKDIVTGNIELLAKERIFNAKTVTILEIQK